MTVDFIVKITHNNFPIHECSNAIKEKTTYLVFSESFKSSYDYFHLSLFDITEAVILTGSMELPEIK